MNTSPLWSSLGVVAPLYARTNGQAAKPITGVSIDTRTLVPGDLFFAIKGEHSDGHDYVAMAFERGAAAAVVDEAHASALFKAGPLYIVHDTLAAMQSLGLTARARSQASIVAITGSVGKTSTKDALALVLSAQGATHASVASYNNHLGVPLTLCRMPTDARFGVFEIGMNHAGEITPLVEMVRPHVAIITTIAPVHLEHFESVDDIADAKAEIFTGLEPGGAVVLNIDVKQYVRLRKAAEDAGITRIYTFGSRKGADARFEDAVTIAEGTRVQARILGRRYTYTVGAPGRHMAMNSLGVLLGVEALGGNLDRAAADLSRFTPPAGRGERSFLRSRGGDFTLVDESYNANPASMRAALSLLRETQVGGRRIAVLGDMLELGPQAADLHADLAEAVVAADVDLVFAAGPLMKHLYDALPGSLRGAWAETSSEIEETLIDIIGAYDIVMVKGSNGARMGPVVAKLKSLFANRDTDLQAEG